MSTVPERLPSRPLRNWLLAWHILTGDPAYVIAKGFDLDPVLVVDLLSAEVPRMLPASEMVGICRLLRIDQRELWDRVAPPSWPVESASHDHVRLQQQLSGRPPKRTSG